MTFKAIAQEEAEDLRLKRSAQIRSLIKQLGIEESKAIADAHFEFPGEKAPTIFLKGLLVGRRAKQQLVFMAAIQRDIFYFIGGESEIINKFREAIDMKENALTDGEEGKTADEIKKLTDQQQEKLNEAYKELDEARKS
jgi:hypothetical protein